RSWSDVIEETLRWQAPIPYLPLRYAIEQIELDGITIAKGEAILSGYASAGRDPDQYGDTAHAFDITRAGKQHLSFGHGVHTTLPANRHAPARSAMDESPIAGGQSGLR
ncbi:MAG TPA: cytochrome P450, partial [Pseudonocardia sp.]|uniref:cytochrome P450 n=1 Tax=Pseudonocardia sp. TaxID=60912 RepID=UPI002CD96D95